MLKTGRQKKLGSCVRQFSCCSLLKSLLFLPALEQFVTCTLLPINTKWVAAVQFVQRYGCGCAPTWSRLPGSLSKQPTISWCSSPHPQIRVTVFYPDMFYFSLGLDGGFLSLGRGKIKGKCALTYFGQGKSSNEALQGHVQRGPHRERDLRELQNIWRLTLRVWDTKVKGASRKSRRWMEEWNYRGLGSSDTAEIG